MFFKYSPDKIILEMRSEIMVMVTMSSKRFATFFHSKTPPHTKFGITTSNDKDTIVLEIMSEFREGQGPNDPKMQCGTLQPQKCILLINFEFLPKIIR